MLPGRCQDARLHRDYTSIKTWIIQKLYRIIQGQAAAKMLPAYCHDAVGMLHDIESISILYMDYTRIIQDYTGAGCCQHAARTLSGC